MNNAQSSNSNMDTLSLIKISQLRKTYDGALATFAWNFVPSYLSDSLKEQILKEHCMILWKNMEKTYAKFKDEPLRIQEEETGDDIGDVENMLIDEIECPVGFTPTYGHDYYVEISLLDGFWEWYEAYATFRKAMDKEIEKLN